MKKTYNVEACDPWGQPSCYMTECSFDNEREALAFAAEYASKNRTVRVRVVLLIAQFS
jgi:hypothetical protein